jgi:hypothetical protein
MKLPPDIDALIWTLAEDGNAIAQDQFRGRYPEYADALDARVTIVKGIKRAKSPAAEARPELPKFSPKANVRPMWTLTPGIAALLLVALGFASFTIVYFASLATRQTAETPKKAAGRTVAVNFPPAGQAPVSVPEKVLPRPQSPTAEPEDPAYLRPQSVSFKGANLSLALKAIAAQGGLDITIAPGLPEETIDVSYSGVTTIEILQDLGVKYRFTPFDQGDGSVLVIPARDESAVAKKVPGTSNPD